MPENTGHQDGVKSFIESIPGGGVAALIVYLSTFTSRPIPLEAAGGLVMLGCGLSSYLMAKSARRKK